MSDKHKRLHQLSAAVRLRALQREKAELAHSRARREQREAEHRLHEEETRYAGLLASIQRKMEAGTVLDPTLHEQRLLAQRVSRVRIEELQRALASARAAQQAAVDAVIRCSCAEKAAGSAHGRIATELRLYAQAQEAIDIGDAQQPREAAHGL